MDGVPTLPGTILTVTGSQDETSILVRMTFVVTFPDGRLIKEREHFRATVGTGLPGLNRVPTAHWWDDDSPEPVLDPY
ncbi:hypothetical protein GCM10022254_23770 [Actinomadura meridiana]|uniref:SnoaL-like domain-containing protein n=1 Tax=Actinomadura meridiana TaxID=559626 RepID=A0ABP8BXT8_9ACTN